MPRMAASPRHGRRPVVALLSLAVALLAACSSQTKPGTGTAVTPLRTALSTLPDSAAARTYLEYGDLARLRSLGAVGAGPHITDGWSGVVGIGADAFASDAVPLKDSLKLDLLAADSAVTIGNAPNTAVRIKGGFSEQSVHDALVAAGAKAHDYSGHAGLQLAPDDRISTAVQARFGVLSRLNQVVVDGSTLAASPNSATLVDVLDKPKTGLLDDHGMSGLVDCLGDSLAAISYAPKDSTSPVAVIAVGVLDPGRLDGQRREVLCVQPRSGKEAVVRSAMKDRFAVSATDPATNAPIGQYVASIDIGGEHGIVSGTATMKANSPVGYLIRSVAAGTVEQYAGGPAVRRR
jgi:hypothetical protein